jgi:hypothetical protein
MVIPDEAPEAEEPDRYSVSRIRASSEEVGVKSAVYPQFLQHCFKGPSDAERYR